MGPHGSATFELGPMESRKDFKRLTHLGPQGSLYSQVNARVLIRFLYARAREKVRDKWSLADPRLFLVMISDT